MPVTNIWVGGVTMTTATVKAKVTGTSARLAISEERDMNGAWFYGPATADNDIVTLTATGLTQNRRYFYAIEDESGIDTQHQGQFVTHPVPGTRASFSYAMATCGGHASGGGQPAYPGVGDVLAPNRLSNHPVYDLIRQRALNEDLLFFLHGGDIHYYDLGSGSHGITGGASLDNYRRAYDDVLLQPNQQGLYRDVPLVFAWDDHDFGPNDSDRLAPGRDNACLAYRERVPSYELASGGGANPIYHSFQVGRVLFIISDVRADRDPNDDPQSLSKTMLGTAQKAWMEQVLTEDNGAEALVWVTPSQWHSNHVDSWTMFQHERNELVNMFGDTGWLNRMVINSGDAHALAIDTGSQPYGHFPIYQFASLDSEPSAGPPFDITPNLPGRGQYGIMNINDRGHTIEITGTGYRMSESWRSHTHYVSVGAPVVTLDYSSGHISPPFEPTDDDQLLVNDATAERIAGGTARHEVTEGPLSVQDPPDGVGRYDSSVTLNVSTDAQLPGHAGWRTHLGTVDEARYPQVHVDLVRNPQLREGITDLDAGDKIVIDNVPAWLPPEPIQMIAEGYSEEINWFHWGITFNASPGSPWTIGQIAGQDPDEVLPATPERADTSGSELVFSVDESVTDMIVLTKQSNGPTPNARWINSDGPGLFHSGEFPFDVRMNGEVLAVNACESLAYDSFDRTEAEGWGVADSGQEWLLSAQEGSDSAFSISDGAARVVLNEDTTDPRLMVADNSDLTDCDITVTVNVDQASDGGSLVPSILLRYNGQDQYYLGRVHITTADNVYLSFATPDGQVDDNEFAGFQVQPGDRISIRARLVDHTLHLKVWPAEHPETHLWQLVRTASNGLIEQGGVGLAALAFSGNTNDGVEMAFRDFELYNPQRFTVERSLNTVVKDHEAGVSVSLDQPAFVGL